jgi:cell division septal protein FtsQ
VPGRYADQLRKLTREQGGAPSGPSSDGPDEGDSPTGAGAAAARRSRRILGAVIVLTLVGVGWFVIDQMVADSKIQDCVMSGRKNCAPVEIDSSGR